MTNLLVIGFHKNMPYAVVMHEFGHMCGYIGIKRKHSWADMSGDDVPCECNGGITYKDEDAPFKLNKDEWCETKKGRYVYHMMQVAEFDRIWIGFDTAHFWDKKIDWTTELMKQECKSMIDQAVKYDSLFAKAKRFFLNK